MKKNLLLLFALSISGLLVAETRVCMIETVGTSNWAKVQGVNCSSKWRSSQDFYQSDM